MTCEGREGLVESIFSVVKTFSPPMYIGYSRPNWPATLARASSMDFLFCGCEKSMKGSLVNSGTCSFTSAVAIARFAPEVATLNSTAFGKRGTTARGPGALPHARSLRSQGQGLFLY